MSLGNNYEKNKVELFVKRESFNQFFFLAYSAYRSGTGYGDKPFVVQPEFFYFWIDVINEELNYSFGNIGSHNESYQSLYLEKI